MRKILIAALLLAAAPAALAAQHVPVPLPADTSRLLPDVAPRLFPESTSRTANALAGALEGAVAGTVYAVAITQTKPACAASNSATESALSGAAAGAIWGGVRGLLGIRGRRGPIRTDVPDPDARAIPAGAVPVFNGRCGSFPRGAFPDLAANTAHGTR